ncbi:Y-family DNA polymerase [Candidatus Mycoplasma pogonae]
MSHKKVIFHIDIDSFFVSAQRSINHSLKNKPVVIAWNRPRAIATAVSYEARKLGIDVTDPVFKLKRNFPHLIIVNPNYELYTYLSTMFFELISKKWTTKIEIISIDECYLDVTDLAQKYGNYNLAKMMQQTINKQLDLPVSIGIAWNKFLAKMATNFAKPFGICELTETNFQQILYPLKIHQFYGIGKSSADKLQQSGIKTIGDFARANFENETIQAILGKRALSLRANALGKGDDKIITERNDLKQIGNSVTFAQAYLDSRALILDVVKQICLKVATRLINRNSYATVFTFEFKLQNHKNFTKRITVEKPLHNFDDLYTIALKLFDKYWDEKPLRGIGFSAANIIDNFHQTIQMTIFEQSETKTTLKVAKIINDINQKFTTKQVDSLQNYAKNFRKKQVQSRLLEEDFILKKN